MMPSEKSCAALAEIKRATASLRSEMARFKLHREALQIENPAAVPVQDAIFEQALKRAELWFAVEAAQSNLENHPSMPQELRDALLEFNRVVKEAYTSIGVSPDALRVPDQ